MQMGGTGRHEVKLSDLIRKLRAAPPDQDTDVYSFDRDSQVFSEVPQLVQSLLDTGSTHFGDVMDNAPTDEQRYFKTRPDVAVPWDSDVWAWYLNLGGRGSGITPHHHGDAWSVLFEGKKRWFMSKPDRPPPITHVAAIPMRFWLDEGVYPRLRADEMAEMLECEQHENELTYVPEGWWHATINEAPLTLSVASQRRDGASGAYEQLVQESARKMGKRRFEDALGLLRNATTLYPSYAQLWYSLGRVQRELPQRFPDRGAKSFRRASKLAGGRNCDMLASLGTALLQQSKLAQAEKLLRKAARLCTWDGQPHLDRAAALQRLGRDEDAAEARELGRGLEGRWKSGVLVDVGARSFEM